MNQYEAVVEQTKRFVVRVESECIGDIPALVEAGEAKLVDEHTSPLKLTEPPKIIKKK